MGDNNNMERHYMDGVIPIYDPENRILGQVVTFDPSAVGLWMYYQGNNGLDGSVLVDPDTMKVVRCQVAIPAPANRRDSLLRKDWPGALPMLGCQFEAQRTIMRLHGALFYQAVGFMIGFNYGLVKRYDGDGYTGDKFVDPSCQLIRCDAIRNHLNVIVTSFHAVVRNTEVSVGVSVFGTEEEFEFLKRDEFEGITMRKIQHKAIQLFQEHSIFREHCILCGETADKLRGQFQELANSVAQQLADFPDGVPRNLFKQLVAGHTAMLMNLSVTQGSLMAVEALEFETD